MKFRKLKLVCFHLIRNPVLLMISGSIIGFVVALIIFFFENIPLVPGDALIMEPRLTVVKSTTYILNEFPDFFTWIMLFTIHTGSTVALGIAALVKLNFFKSFRIRRKEAALALGLVIVMVFISSTSYILPFNSGKYYRWPVTPLNHMWPKIITLLGISISSAAISVLGLILIGCIC